MFCGRSCHHRTTAGCKAAPPTHTSGTTQYGRLHPGTLKPVVLSLRLRMRRGMFQRHAQRRRERRRAKMIGLWLGLGLESQNRLRAVLLVIT